MAKGQHTSLPPYPRQLATATSSGRRELVTDPYGGGGGKTTPCLATTMLVVGRWPAPLAVVSFEESEKSALLRQAQKHCD